MVTLLLADGRVDPDLTNQYGRTAITCASLVRRHSVVKLLLADDAVGLTSFEESAKDTHQHHKIWEQNIPSLRKQLAGKLVLESCLGIR